MTFKPILKIDINENIDLTTPVHVKGESSGAEGFIRHNVSAGTKLLQSMISRVISILVKY